MTLRLKIRLFISLLFAAAIVNSAFIFMLERFSEEKLHWVTHTHEVILTTEKLLGSITDMETGQRGYLLIQDTNYLEPYHAGLFNAERNFNELRALTQDNDKQQANLVRIEKDMKLKSEELAETIALVNGDNKLALDVVKKDSGKYYMERIRRGLTNFVHHEKILLEQRKAEFSEHKVMITTLIIVEVVAFVILAILSLLFMNKNLFDPLNLLLTSTKKMQDGKRVLVSDITSKDEMGYLLSSFFKMNEIVHTRAENLDYLANHDELTGLQNRKPLNGLIKNAIAYAKESGTKVAILFIDLNKFKSLNDTQGHDAGDAMLIEVAARLKTHVRSNDLVFRLGGDEFVILLAEFNDTSEVKKIVDNILHACKKPVLIQNKEIEMSLSIGVAISPDDAQGYSELLKLSDIAMYEAKQDIKTHYKFFTLDMLKKLDEENSDLS